MLDQIPGASVIAVVAALAGSAVTLLLGLVSNRRQSSMNLGRGQRDFIDRLMQRTDLLESAVESYRAEIRQLHADYNAKLLETEQRMREECRQELDQIRQLYGVPRD